MKYAGRIGLFALLMLLVFALPAGAQEGLQLPAQLTRIEDEAFMNSTAVLHAALPEGLEAIGARAFAGSTVQEMVIPQSVTQIAEDAFDGCEALTLRVHRNSYAHLWCYEHDMRYEIIESGAPQEIETRVHAVEIVNMEDGDVIRATVSAKDACVLRTDVLSDDGRSTVMTMTEDVPAGTVKTAVDVEVQSALPAYFVLRAVLEDAQGNPLCDAVTTRRYTSAYAEASQQQQGSYETSRVIDFGDSGYAVLAEGAHVLGEATLSGGQYTFAAAQALSRGDVVSVTVGGEQKVMRIASVTDNGDGTVTVSPDGSARLGDLYSAINLDANLVSGVSGQGLENLDKTLPVINIDKSLGVGPAELTVHSEMSIHVRLLYEENKLGEDYFEIELTAKSSGTIGVSLTGQIDTWKTDDAPAIQLYNSVVIIPGISAPAFLSVSLPINIKAACGGSASFGYENTTGFRFNPDDGFVEIDKGDSSAEAKIEGQIELFAGPEISLTMSLFDLISARIGGQFGAKVTGEVEMPSYGGSTADEDEPSRHACFACVDIDILAAAQMRGTLQYNITEELSGTLMDMTIAAYEEKLYDAYYSFDNEAISIHKGEKVFGMDACPNLKHHVRVRTIGLDDKEEEGIPIRLTGEKTETLSGPSPYHAYLYPGSYTAEAAFELAVTDMNFTVSDAPKYLTLEEKEVVLTVSVVDNDTNAPIPGAQIMIEMPGIKATVIADQDGKAKFDRLPGGPVTITVGAENYSEKTFTTMSYLPGTNNSVSIALVSSVLPDVAIVRKVMDTIGEDLMARLLAEGMYVDCNFDYYAPTDTTGNLVPGGTLHIELEIRTAYKSLYPYTVNDALVNEVYQALLRADVMGWSAEETAEAAAYTFSRSNRFYDVTFDSGNTVVCGGTPDDQVVIDLRTKHMRTSSTITRRWYRYWHNGEIELTNVKD